MWTKRVRRGAELNLAIGWEFVRSCLLCDVKTVVRYDMERKAESCEPVDRHEQDGNGGEEKCPVSRHRDGLERVVMSFLSCAQSESKRKRRSRERIWKAVESFHSWIGRTLGMRLLPWRIDSLRTGSLTSLKRVSAE